MAKPISAYNRARQIAQGLYDSPCLSACCPDPDSSICAECGLSREERGRWPTASLTEKSEIRAVAHRRLAQTLPLSMTEAPHSS